MKTFKPRQTGLGLRRRTALALSGLALLATSAGPGHTIDSSDASQASGGLPSSTSAPDGASPHGKFAQIVFLPGERAVSNWQSEAAANLSLSPGMKAALSSNSDVPGIPRCVKLNNYWCIKRARWAGEIAADAVGHVAFASAAEGATAAAMLLRRYYVDLNRRSAKAIISHWAPAQCGALRSTASTPLPSLAAIAPFGIQNTLRARWLTAHRPGLLGQSQKFC